MQTKISSVDEPTVRDEKEKQGCAKNQLSTNISA